jgi:hypothetical protein
MVCFAICSVTGAKALCLNKHQDGTATNAKNAKISQDAGNLNLAILASLAVKTVSFTF